jgi:FG-GAP-like repeat/FG-GAP repeat
MQRRTFTITIFVAALVAAVWFVGAGSAAPPPISIVTGQDAGWPDVRGWNDRGGPAQQWAPWGESPLAFSPYATYQQGVRVAVGDVNGDGRPEIVTAPGGSAFTELRVFDGRTFNQLESMLPFKDGAWWAGAYVATGDTNGDGRDEIVEGLDAGCCTMLHVLDGKSGDDLSGWFPYGGNSQVGARVTSADVNGDGKAELLAVPLGSARVSIYGAAGGAAIRSIDAFGSDRAGPTSIAAGNVIGDARAELIAAAPTDSGPEVKIIDVSSGETRASFYPYGGIAVPSVEVALGDVNGDGSLDIVLSASTAGGTEVKAIDADGAQLGDFYVLDPGILPGASLAAGDLDGDGRAEIVLGSGPTTDAPWPPVQNGPDQRVAVYEPNGTSVGSFSAYPGLFQGGVRVALADLDRDHRPEIVTAPGPGTPAEIDIFSQQWVNGRDRGTRLGHFLAFDPTFLGGASVATGDIDGDGNPEIVVAAGKGHSPEVKVFDASGRELFSFLAFDSSYLGGLSVAAGDLDGDGRAEIVVGTLASPAHIRIFEGATRRGPDIAPFVPNGPGVDVGVADVAGNGNGSIVAGAATGTHPLLATIDPSTGAVLHSIEIGETVQNGVRVAGGDLNGDGRDEIVATPGWGGDGQVRVFDASLEQIRAFTAYNWAGAGMNVALATRIGLPIAAQSRTVRLTMRRRTRIVVARFRDAAGGSASGLRASIDWGDGMSWNGKVLARGGGVYDVRSLKRYGRRGRYALTVTLTDSRGRTSIARSTAIVIRKR